MKKIKFLTSSIELGEENICFSIRPSLINYIGVIIYPIVIYNIIENNTPPLFFRIVLFLMFMLVVARAMYYQKFTVSLNENSVQIQKKIEPFGLTLSRDLVPLRTSIFYIEKPLTKFNNTASWRVFIKGFEKEIIVFETLDSSDIRNIESFFEQNGINILRNSR